MANEAQPTNRLGKEDHSFDAEHIQKTTLSTELTIVTHKDEITLPSQYSEYTDVFSEQTFDILPPRCDFDHAINLKETFTSKVAKLYPLNPAELTACKSFVDENLKTGWIQPLKSPQASPFFFVKKKDRKLCPVQDYQYLNEHTVKNAYPLPLISDLVDNLCHFLFLPSSMYNGVITISGSKKGMNGRLHSLLPSDCSNQQ